MPIRFDQSSTPTMQGGWDYQCTIHHGDRCLIEVGLPNYTLATSGHGFRAAFHLQVFRDMLPGLDVQAFIERLLAIGMPNPEFGLAQHGIRCEQQGGSIVVTLEAPIYVTFMRGDRRDVWCRPCGFVSLLTSVLAFCGEHEKGDTDLCHRPFQELTDVYDRLAQVYGSFRIPGVDPIVVDGASYPALLSDPRVLVPINAALPNAQKLLLLSAFTEYLRQRRHQEIADRLAFSSQFSNLPEQLLIPAEQTEEAEEEAQVEQTAPAQSLRFSSASQPSMHGGRRPWSDRDDDLDPDEAPSKRACPGLGRST